jgi:hypothetical protein
VFSSQLLTMLAFVPALARSVQSRGAGGARKRHGLAARYVSTDCPVGDITLTLGDDGAFLLVLAIWDPVVRDHVGRRMLRGNWRFVDECVELDAGARRLRYRLAAPSDAQDTAPTPRASSTLRWERSDLPTFADGFTLVERAANTSTK